MTSEAEAPAERVEIHDLLMSFGGLIKSGKYSDLIIKCHDKEFKAHRAIVCPRSKPLAAMIDGVWKEAQTGVVDLEDDEPEIVDKMMQFLYNLSYDDHRGTAATTSTPVANESTDVSTPIPPSFSKQFQENQEASWVPSGPLVVNAQVYVLAEKYDIPSLKDLACRKYEEIADVRWNAEQFSASIAIAYDGCVNAKEEMKTVMVATTQAHVTDLVGRDEFASLLRNYGDFSYDVLHGVIFGQPAIHPFTKFSCYHRYNNSGYCSNPVLNERGGCDRCGQDLIRLISNS